MVADGITQTIMNDFEIDNGWDKDEHSFNGKRTREKKTNTYVVEGSTGTKITLITILRWIAAFPAASLGAIVAGFIGKLFVGINLNPEENVISISSIIGKAIGEGATGLAFVFIAAYIAPKGKYTVSVIACVLICLLSCFSAVYGWRTINGLDCFYHIEGCISAIVFAIITTCGMKEEYDV